MFLCEMDVDRQENLEMQLKDCISLARRPLLRFGEMQAQAAFQRYLFAACMVGCQGCRGSQANPDWGVGIYRWPFDN